MTVSKKKKKKEILAIHDLNLGPFFNLGQATVYQVSLLLRLQTWESDFFFIPKSLI